MPEFALAFDMYGTLVEPAKEPQEVAAAWRRHQLEITWLVSLLERYEDFGAVTAYALDAALAESGIELPEAKRQELLERARVPRLFEDVPEALEALASAGLTMAVFSNGTPRQLETIVHEHGIERYFADLISVDEVGVYKPAPAVYRRAAARLGRPIEHVWLVSANPFDVAGAKLAGMRAAKVERSPSFAYGFAPPVDLVVGSLAELAGGLG